jgi:nucleoside-diphosphate-sugar epimerase
MLLYAHKSDIWNSHVASPVVVDAADVANDLLKPAVQGTVGVLQAALASPTVRAVAITSSIGSVFDPKFGWRPGYTYTAVCVASSCDRESQANYAFVR